MRTPINKETFSDFIITKDRVDLDFLGKGFFTFTNYTNYGDFLDIGRINCKEAFKLFLKPSDSREGTFFGYDFCFDDDLPILIPKVREGDIINIRTMIDLEFFHLEDIDFDVKYDGMINQINDLFSYSNIYMIIILIELDPL